MEKEIWKDIKNYEGLYKISNWGRLHSVPKDIICNCYKKSNGYIQCDLYKNGQRKHFHIQRLVAEYFVDNPNPEEFIEVNHIDLNKSNNYYKNLEWCTRGYNQKHAAQNGKMKGWIRYTKADIDSLRKDFITNNVTQISLAKQYNISAMQVSRILRNESRTKF